MLSRLDDNVTRDLALPLAAVQSDSRSTVVRQLVLTTDCSALGDSDSYSILIHVAAP